MRCVDPNPGCMMTKVKTLLMFLIDMEKTLLDLLKDVTFENVFTELVYWFPDQMKSIDGYKKVFNDLLKRTPRKHYPDDLVIEVKIYKDGKDEYLHVNGKKSDEDANYGLEFSGWTDWITMYISQESLDTLNKEVIVAGCLYEMTFFGFEERTVVEHRNHLVKNFEDLKNETGR